MNRYSKQNKPGYIVQQNGHSDDGLDRKHSLQIGSPRWVITPLNFV